MIPSIYLSINLVRKATSSKNAETKIFSEGDIKDEEKDQTAAGGFVLQSCWAWEEIAETTY